MANYTALAEVGESLINVLWQAIQPDTVVNQLIDNPDRLSLQSPFDLREDQNETVRLSLYLYRIVEDAQMKNQWPVAGPGGVPRKPPLTLDLYYLVTPLVGSPREQQIILGKVMQVFYDRAHLVGADLAGSLLPDGDPLHIVLNPVSLEETTRIWQAMEMSYRLSVCYVVRVALLNSQTTMTGQPVLQKASQYGEKEQERNGTL